MVDAGEWRWITEHATGGYDHLVIGTSLPLIMAPGLHYLEAWNEAVCDGAWGRLASRLAEKIRQGADLEHWPAFRDSFEAMCALLREVGAGGRGHAPASIVVVSGDVHHAYLAEVGFPAGSGVSSRVWQATCSPFRNPLSDKERRGVTFTFSRRRQGGRAHAGPPRRRSAAAGAMALSGRRPAVRQPGRHARARRPPGAGAARARAGRRPDSSADEHALPTAARARVTSTRSPNGVFAVP